MRFDSSSSKPETPVMDLQYRSRFGIRVIGRCAYAPVVQGIMLSSSKLCCIYIFSEMYHC